MRHILILIFIVFVTKFYAQSDTVSFIFVGDIMNHGPQIRSAKDTLGQYNFEDVYKYISPTLKKYDYAVGNLELTLSNKGKYTGYPRFRSPDILAKNLKNAGFDMLTTSNNHSNDGYKYGVEHTIEILNENDIEHTGTFCDSTDYLNNYPLIQNIKGIKVAFLNYTYGTNGLPTKLPTIVNIIDETTIKADIIKAKSKNPDIIIGLLHWGWEYNIYPNKFQKKIRDVMFKNGVDLIIGGHPHVVQPINCIDTPLDSVNYTSNFIAYSLGNFVSNQKKPKTDGGIMVEIKMIKDNNEISISQPKYIPIWRYIDKSNSQKHKYHILPISICERDSTFVPLTKNERKKMHKFAKNVRNHLYPYDCSEEKL